MFPGSDDFSSKFRLAVPRPHCGSADLTLEVVVNGEVLGSASGKAKKEAEQEAARLALLKLRS